MVLGSQLGVIKFGLLPLGGRRVLLAGWGVRGGGSAAGRGEYIYTLDTPGYEVALALMKPLCIALDVAME